MSLSLMPPNALVGLITFGKMVRTTCSTVCFNIHVCQEIIDIEADVVINSVEYSPTHKETVTPTHGRVVKVKSVVRANGRVGRAKIAQSLQANVLAK